MDRKEFISRIGTYFLLVGSFLLLIFIGTDIGDDTKFGYFFGSVPLLFFGWYFKRVTAPPPKPGGNRFEGLRKWRQKQREAKAKREAKKKEREEKKRQKQQKKR